MKRKSGKPAMTQFLPLATGLLLVFTLVSAGCGQPVNSQPISPATAKSLPASSPVAATVSSATCLGCHGPYEKVVQASATYTLSNGEKVNPHTTIDPTTPAKPHASGKGVSECSNCHKPHPVPLASPKDVVRANTDYCFSCHHQRNFTPCIQCHPEGTG
jgi:predicted CXXCH cytochrome family protein